MVNIDLTTLQGWNDLPDGTYDITVGAKADGYTRIKQSDAVSVVKGNPEPGEEYFLTFKSMNGTQFNTHMTAFNAETSERAPGISWDGTVEYSIDKNNWNVWDGTSVSSSVNGEIYFRGIGNTYFANITNVIFGSFFFDITNDTIAIEGNIENLLDYQEVELGNHPTMATYCFLGLFGDIAHVAINDDIEDASKLVLGSTTLADNCYANMFDRCTSLTSAPELPATTLAYGCYASMFSGCTSLTTVPELSPTTLTESCYGGMFSGCTSLIVSDTQTPDAQYEWRIPGNGVITGTTHQQINMFVNCLGTRSSDDFAGEVGQQYIYYTQNPPVGSN